MGEFLEWKVPILEILFFAEKQIRLEIMWKLKEEQEDGRASCEKYKYIKGSKRNKVWQEPRQDLSDCPIIPN